MADNRDIPGITSGWFNENRTAVEQPRAGNKFDDYVLQWCLEVFRYSRDTHEREWCQDHFVYYRYYKNYVEQRVDPDDYHANFGVGLAYSIVKLLSSRLMSVWQGSDWLIDATALDDIGKQLAPRVAAYVNNKWFNHVPRMYSKMELCKESALAMGRGVMKPRTMTIPQHKKLVRKIREMFAGMLPGGPARMDAGLTWNTVPPQQRYDVDVVDPFNFWWIGPTKWSSDVDLTCERMYTTHGRVVRAMQSGEFKSHEISSGNAKGYDQYTIRRHQLDGGASDNVRANELTPKPHSIWEMQGWIETPKTKNGNKVYELRLVQILDEQYLLKNELLATWDAKPGYIVFEPMMDPCGDRPIGFIEPIEQILLTINDLINIAFDNCRKLTESPLMIDPQATKQEALFLGPGEMNLVKDPQRSVAPVPMKDLPESLYRMLTFLMDLIQRNTGVNDALGGLNTAETQRWTPGMKTAKGFGMMQQQAADRFSPIVTKMDLELYRPMAVDLHETAKLHMHDEEHIPFKRNPSAPFTRIGPKDLDILLEFAFNTNALNQAQYNRRGEFIEMVQLLGQLQQQQQLPPGAWGLDLYETARMMLDEFGRSGDVDKIIQRVEQMGMGMPPGPGASPYPTLGQPQVVPGAPAPPLPAPPAQEAA